MKCGSGLSMHAKFSYLLVGLFLITLLFGYIWFRQSIGAIKDNAIAYSTQLVQTTNAHLDSYFSDIEKLMLPMLSSKQTLDFITDSGADAFSRYTTAYAIENELIRPIMLNRSEIYDISLVTENNIASSSRSFLDAQSRYRKYDKLLAEVGSFKVIGSETLGMNELNTLTMAMRFVNTRTLNTTGMLIVDLYVSRIENTYKNIRLGESGFVWLMDGNGKIVTYPDSSRISEQAPNLYLKRFGEADHGYYVTSSEGEDKLVIYERSKKTGLTMVAEVKIDELDESLVRLSRLSMICMISFFAVLFFIVGGVGYRFTKSIVLLKRLMIRAEMGDLTVLAPSGKQDEIGSLYRSFNSMVTEIGRLIHVVHSGQLRERNLVIQQKEAVLSALQSQINPHFLNNTLEIINSYAIMDENFKVSKMIVALGDMFRYSMGSPTAIVSLADEMNHLRSYLRIQQERFERLQLDVQVADNDAESCLGVRLMLQPIVENSFKHGYDKHKLRPGKISIVGQNEFDGYALYIGDTGKGMDPETLERINRILLSGETGYSTEDEDPQPIGMMNVHFRLRMVFGEPFGLSIVRSDLEGTTVRMLIPRNNKESELEGCT